MVVSGSSNPPAYRRQPGQPQGHSGTCRGATPEEDPGLDRLGCRLLYPATFCTPEHKTQLPGSKRRSPSSSYIHTTTAPPASLQQTAKHASMTPPLPSPSRLQCLLRRIKVGGSGTASV